MNPEWKPNNNFLKDLTAGLKSIRKIGKPQTPVTIIGPNTYKILKKYEAKIKKRRAKKCE